MTATPGQGSDLVDWDLAVATARRLIPPGPSLRRPEAGAVVVQLRELADEAAAHVIEHTGLRPQPSSRTGTCVVDRPTWAANNVTGLRLTLAPLLAQLAGRRSGRAGRDQPPALVGAAGRKATGLELGAVLAFLSTKILGQYEVFLPPEAGDGRLSLVAPNIVEVERRLGADPRDFRLWVCLHEQTHHAQFAATPWLKGHLAGLITRLADSAELDARAVLDRLWQALRTREGGVLPGGPLAVLQSPEQRAVVGELQALMTLLEGHADYVMDAVGPRVVPTVAEIRRGFEERRRAGSPLEWVIRRVLGLDAKLAQYRLGGAFCRAVVQEAGPEALRSVFAGPELLPTKSEFTDPASWLARTAAVRA